VSVRGGMLTMTSSSWVKNVITPLVLLFRK